MEAILKKITDFADNAHGDQMRKYTPERYIVHPIRVMKLLQEYSNDVCVLAAALLHDVLEDTPVSVEEIRSFLLRELSPADVEKTIQLVIELTDVYVKEDFPHLNRRARKAKELQRLEKTSADSQTIKYADIIDNTKEIIKHDPDFARVFLFECRTNLKKLDKGNRKLYMLATDAVNTSINSLKTGFKPK